MRYLFIDCVTYLERDKLLKGIKNVSLSEDFFTDHFYGNPIFPGALQIETLAQAGTILLEISSEFKFKALLAMIQNAKFRRLVRPGDRLTIEAGLFSKDSNIYQINGTIMNGEELVTSGRLTFFMEPIDTYYPPAVRHMTRLFYETVLRGADLVGVEFPGDEFWNHDG